MSTIFSLTTASKSSKAEAHRHKVVKAVVELITENGFHAASQQRIADRAGVSLGTVQNFGNHTQLLDAVFQYAHETYLSLVDNEELLEGTLKERVQLYVTISWHHYQSDLYLAVLETLLATRNQRTVSTYLLLQPELEKNHLAKIRKIFPECTLDDRNLIEAMRCTHCFLTGLTLDKLLEPSLGNLGGYIRRAIQSMTAMIENKD